MSKQSTTGKHPSSTNVWHSSQINANTEQESSIQKHVKFWDKTNKGYITPLDTISGFITLGYSVIFSVAIGTFVGVLLSIFTQTGWLPDPLCRSHVQNLIRAKKGTQSNSGAFDDDGVFVPEKFDSLFSKYAKSDKSGKTIAVAELARMIQDQEKPGKDVKAWVTCVVKLSAAYFFIGHRGSLTKEDVCSAYDGSMFYRLKDTHRLMIQDRKQRSYTENNLKGSYLSKPAGVLSVKAVEQQLLSLYSALQSKSYGATSEYRVGDWVSYIWDSTSTIKNALPRALKRPTSIINGVTTPKPSIYRTASKVHDDPSELFPDGLTGVAKAESQVSPMGTDFLSSFLHHGSGDDSVGTRGLLSSSDESTNDDDQRESNIFKHLTDEDASSSMSPHPIASSSTSSANAPLMNGYLRKEECDNDWLAGGLTGVQHESKPAVEIVKKTTNIPTKPSHQIPTPPPQSDQHEEMPKAAITPPPEEKPVLELPEKNSPAPAAASNTGNNKKPLPVNKVKGKNKKNKSGQVSPISSGDSSQEQTPSNTIPHSPIDVSWAISADAK